MNKIFPLILFNFFILSSYADMKIFLFGDEDYERYLGCFNCPISDVESIHYPHLGIYSSKESPISIFNHQGRYGSAQSEYSPCNESASTPPLLIGEDEKFYGFLTLNINNPKRFSASYILPWLERICVE